MDIFNDDFHDFIQCLNAFNVAYILVGGYAVIIRGYSRLTGDMDIWAHKTEENYHKLLNAITEFGLPREAVVICIKKPVLGIYRLIISRQIQEKTGLSPNSAKIALQGKMVYGSNSYHVRYSSW